MKVHPQYDPVSYANDVAVLELAEPLDADTVAGAVCLPLLPLEQYRQTGLKYTEHKPFGRHYLGVIRNTMSFAVHNLTQVKAGADHLPPSSTCSEDR